jgi:hypothetical protein
VRRRESAPTGELRLHFKNTNGVAKPESANLTGFSGTGENPGKVFRFTLEYTVIFEFRNGRVTDLHAKPEVVCKR